MKVYAIKNIRQIFAYLFINKEYDDCYIEIVPNLDSYPIFFESFINKNEYVINSYWSYRWINERIIPSNRQNINNILKYEKMNSYNELKMLIASKARSSMDDNYIEEVKITEVSETIINRRKHLIKDFIFLKQSSSVIVFFENDESRLLKINNQNTPFISCFGSELIFTSTTRYTYDHIYNIGIEYPIAYTDILNYIKTNIISSNEVQKEFGISRQYINKLKQNNRVESINNDLFIKNNMVTYKYKR